MSRVRGQVVHARMMAKSVAWLFLRGPPPPPPNQGSFNSKDSVGGKLESMYLNISLFRYLFSSKFDVP